jgi:hypothetical protein
MCSKSGRERERGDEGFERSTYKQEKEEEWFEYHHY